MKDSERTRELLIEHYRQYPLLQPRDIFKFLFQSSFGCEHMVSSAEAAIEYIRKEYARLSARSERLIDELDGDYSRVNLSYLDRGLSAETLGKLFCLSAKRAENGRRELLDKLSVARELVSEKELPFGAEDFDNAVAQWQTADYAAIHHSETFRASYNPAYRVIANRYVTYLPLFAEIDAELEKENRAVTVACGKTDLSEMLGEIYDCSDLLVEIRHELGDGYAINN